MLVAAEASGDGLGAGLARALRQRLPNVRFVGVGGPAMAAQGVASAFDITELSVFGLVEGLMAYPRVRARVADVVALAQREKPDVAVLIDSFGFTVRVARAMREAGLKLPLIKYVGPQVWASRPGRAKGLAGSFDHLLAILPFDAPFYEPLGLPVTFVGNPALKELPPGDGARFRQSIGAGAEDPVLLLLPGSRPSEIARMTPRFEAAARILKADRPDLHLVTPVAPTVTEAVRTALAGWRNRVHLVEGEQAKRDAMAAAAAALACSGTVTLELAMAGVPMVVGYRLSAATYALLKPMLKVRYATLFNIAADREVAPELLQGDCTGEQMAAETARLLDDPVRRERQVREQFEALTRLGRGMPDPSAKAAEVVAGYLDPR
jgi:lipid-A-disaccharide synthase